MDDRFAPFRQKMQSAGLSQAAIAAFERSYNLLVGRGSASIAESDIRPVRELPSLEQVSKPVSGGEAKQLLAKTVLLKLNGGLGTGMGLDRAKSLLPVRGGDTFLDLIVRQVLAFRKATGADLRFLLLNSFSTSHDTLSHLTRYSELGDPKSLELMQNKVPKIDAETLAPIGWPADPELEWCPPGHGDLYPAMLGSGMLKELLDQGFLYLFVSNSDNLGATLDTGLLKWFAESEKSFVMEVTARTAADRKGGHLALRASDGRFLLRESAQCPEADMVDFQDISRHRYFNTNNLWLRLDHLAAELEKNGGLIPLPVIQNKKTVDPRDKKSPVAYQLETAMGAAIESFENAGAVVVPRTRFSPVKTTGDLLVLRSDASVITGDGQAALDPRRKGIPPEVVLDADHYKIVDQLDAAIANGVPSLIDCTRLDVEGPVQFSSGNRFEGNVTLHNKTGNPVQVPDRVYKDETVSF